MVPFKYERHPVADTALAEAMLGKTWRRDAPVPLEELTLLCVDHLGLDGTRRRGEIIVHRRIAPLVVAIFRDLYVAQFPIEKMRLLHHYDGDDEASMADNNSSAFNARPLTGQSAGWSKHSYGVAIDINPVINPYVTAEACLPAEGQAYLDRDRQVPGHISPGSVCYDAFVSRGFIWGGEWTDLKDYHHFELPLASVGY